MKNPTVTAVCLTADRQAMTDRAVASFLSQTYKQSHLLIYDTGKKPYRLDCLASSRIQLVRPDPELRGTIGQLRNGANTWAKELGGEIITHMDSDDWSGPYRIEDQVQSLIHSGKECVGYRSVLFWRDIPHGVALLAAEKVRKLVRVQEAWAYHNINPAYCIGASFCYWRRVWERQKFREDLPGPERGMGEDKEWLNHVDSRGYASHHSTPEYMPNTPMLPVGQLLVCELHGGNTMKYSLDDESRGPTGWKRVPEWDAKLQEIMQL